MSCTCRLACFLECVAELSLWEDKGPKLCMLPFRYDLHLLPVSQYEPIWYHCSPLKDSFLNAVVLVCLIFSSLTLLQSQSFISKGRLQAFAVRVNPTFHVCVLPDASWSFPAFVSAQFFSPCDCRGLDLEISLIQFYQQWIKKSVFFAI